MEVAAALLVIRCPLQLGCAVELRQLSNR
jgi:hypothetical protein